MKDNEAVDGELSPCLRIFIESLLNNTVTKSTSRDADGIENSTEKKGSGKAKRPELKNPRWKMAKNISLVLHRFKDVRTSILALIFEDSPTFSNDGAQMYLSSRELSDLLQKMGKTHEEAAQILERVIPTPSHYRLHLGLNDEQEKHARRVFTEPW
jgi:hypothetical protein